MKKLFLILTLFISFKLIAQNPSNYQYRTVRERLIASMLDSSHHVPRYNGIPVGLRVGSSYNAGAIAADTLNHGFFLYSGQLWRKVGTEGVKCGLTCNSCGLVTWAGTGLVFEVTAADYNLNGQSYHVAGDDITLDAADGSFDRFDAIVLTSSGLSKVTGTASADPQLPQFDPCASVLLTYVFVQTGATTPVQVSDELIYDENAETWTHTTSGTISANFASTVTSSVGTKSIAIASWSNNANIIFTAPSTLTTSNYTTFSFYLKLGTTMTSNQNISVQFFNGTTAISNIVPAPFTKSYTSSFQGAVMSMSQFTFTNSSFTAIKLIFSGSNSNTVYIDFARLQSGITQPPSGQTYTARLPIRITGTVISADTSTAFVPSLTTNGRLLKVADSIRVAAIAGSSASLTSGYVGYGSGGNTLTGEAAFNYNAVDDILNTYVLQANNLLLFDFNSIGTPPSGWTGIYSDSHGRVYSKNDAGTIVELTNTAGGSGWALDGNALTAGSEAGDFIGSTNNVSMRFRTNNLERMVLDSLGGLYINESGESPISGAGLIMKTKNSSGSNYVMYIHSGASYTGEYFSIENSGHVRIGSGMSFTIQSGSTSTFNGTVTQNSTSTINNTTGLTVAEMSTPATPSAGFARIYPKSDGLIYGISDAGVETKLSNAAATASTLQQVFDTEVGGSVLTKNDTVQLSGFNLSFLGGNVGIGVVPSSLFRVGSGANGFLVVDPTNGLYEFGDLNGVGNSTYIDIQDNLAKIDIRATNGVEIQGRLRKTQGTDVASAVGAIALSSDGNTFEITGTSAITLISNIGWINGSEVTLIFTSTASLTDGTANSGTDIGMELAANTNFTGSADDTITLVLCEIGGTQRWREKCRSVN